MKYIFYAKQDTFFFWLQDEMIKNVTLEKKELKLKSVFVSRSL
jgi:hypothetical protein